jgi:hypothetical protein
MAMARRCDVCLCAMTTSLFVLIPTGGTASELEERTQVGDFCACLTHLRSKSLSPLPSLLSCKGFCFLIISSEALGSHFLREVETKTFEI